MPGYEDAIAGCSWMASSASAAAAAAVLLLIVASAANSRRARALYIYSASACMLACPCLSVCLCVGHCSLAGLVLHVTSVLLLYDDVVNYACAVLCSLA